MIVLHQVDHAGPVAAQVHTIVFHFVKFYSHRLKNAVRMAAARRATTIKKQPSCSFLFMGDIVAVFDFDQRLQLCICQPHFGAQFTN